MTEGIHTDELTEQNWTDETASESETAIKRHLSHQGATDSLAGAIADAAADAGLNRMEIGYEDRGSSKTIYVHSGDNAVPDVLHERLTDMGFAVMDRYDHTEGVNGPRGCKYEDTKY